MKYTKLMRKLFSDSTPEEFKEVIAEKVEEAQENGSSELIDGDDEYQFAEVDDSVIVEDKSADEVTRFTENPEDPDDLITEAVEVEEDETPEVEEEIEKEVEEVKTESKRPRRYSEEVEEEVEVEEDETPEVEIEEVESTEGEVTYSVHFRNFSNRRKRKQVLSAISRAFSEEGENVEITDENDEVVAVEEENNYSIKFTNFSNKRKLNNILHSIRKSFSEEGLGTEVTDEEGNVVEAEQVEEVEKSTESKCSKRYTDNPEVKEVEEEVEKLDETVEELKETEDPKVAEEVVAACDKLEEKVDYLESKGENVADLKDQVTQFSYVAKAVLYKAFTEGTKITTTDGTEITVKPAPEAPEDTPMNVLLGEEEEEEAEDIAVNPNQPVVPQTVGASKVFSHIERVESMNPYLDIPF